MDAPLPDVSVILQNGMAKSGNYWLYRCLQALLADAGVPMRSYIQNHAVYSQAKTWSLSFPEQASIDVMDVTPDGYFTRISSKFSEEITDLDAYFGQVRHLWSHSPYREAKSDAVYARCKAVFYVYRDPRDALLSQADFMFSDYGKAYLNAGAGDRQSFLADRASSYPVHWRNHVEGHLAAADRHPICFMRYESMKADLTGELARMAAAMGLETPGAERLSKIAAGLGFDAMKARSDTGHLNKGRSGRWREALTPEQAGSFTRLAGGTMEKLGYEV